MQVPAADIGGFYSEGTSGVWRGCGVEIGAKLVVSKVERDGNKGATVLEFSSYFNESPGGMDKLVCPWRFYSMHGFGALSHGHTRLSVPP
ncbi:MAG: hypothetical protein OZ917_05835 [Candidatus Brocadiaceae bacterium]|nr:hypothetical protein [Candidatus Brocadiaceae bacterium]